MLACRFLVFRAGIHGFPAWVAGLFVHIEPSIPGDARPSRRIDMPNPVRRGYTQPQSNMPIALKRISRGQSLHREPAKWCEAGVGRLENAPQSSSAELRWPSGRRPLPRLEESTLDRWPPLSAVSMARAGVAARRMAWFPDSPGTRYRACAARSTRLVIPTGSSRERWWEGCTWSSRRVGPPIPRHRMPRS